jgi:hypothetical protein
LIVPIQDLPAFDALQFENTMFDPGIAHAMWMFKDAINGYVRENTELAHSVCNRDKQLGRYESRCKHEINRSDDGR